MKVVVLAGDGIGPEVIRQARRVLSAVAPSLEYEEALIGGVAIDAEGVPLPQATVDACKNADAVLMGAIGAPQYDSLPSEKKPEKGLLQLRAALDVFANLRPAICYPALATASTLKTEIIAGLDILIVRELTGGIYFGEPRGIDSVDDSGGGQQRIGYNTMRYSEAEITRIAHRAFAAARLRGGRLCSVDKANVLEVSMLWREVVSELGARDYADVELTHQYVDNAAMQLVRNPKQFDVIVTGNLFGDILSDAAAMLVGSIGLLPSASLNNDGVGLYEPVHGSAPDIAGKDIANPLAAVLSAAMMLRYSLNMPDAAARIEAAVAAILAEGYRTNDIMPPAAVAEHTNEKWVGCEQMGDVLLDYLANEQ